MPRPFDLKTVLAPLASIAQKLDARRDYLLAEVQKIEEQLARLGGRSKRVGRPPAGGDDDGSSAAPRKGKRIRRKREDVEAEAQQVVDFIKSAGKQGLSAKDIRGKFRISAPSINSYLKAYAPGAKVKTTGNKASMRYFA